MKILFIGGTGILSSACSELAIARGHKLFVLNRSTSMQHPLPDGATLLKGDVHADEAQLASLMADHRFDAVVDYIAFSPHDIERDLRLFRGKTDQFMFISSASAYQKPVKNYLITEETTLENPFWEYSHNKIACENLLMKEHRENGLPVTIIRPSHTYGYSQLPFGYASWRDPWTTIDRIKRGKKIIVPGDGTSLWVLTWNGDFAKGLVGLLGNKKAIGEAFQVTSDQVLSWDQIHLEAYQALGLKPNVIHIPSDFIARFDKDAVGSLIGDKSNSMVFDNSKIKHFVPGFRCEVEWAEGLRRSLAWFEAHPEFQTVDREADQLWDRIIATYERALV
jgi:nucleoside-diphosphate-sugar epimerase